MERVSIEQSSLNRRKVFDEYFNKTNPKNPKQRLIQKA